jgi:hypothetical protein
MVKRARRLIALRFPPDLIDALHEIRAQSGEAVTAQIETAVRAYLKRRGVSLTAARPSAAWSRTRKPRTRR